MYNNEYRKRIVLFPHEIIYEEDSIYNKVIWVEGIGNLNYFLSNEFQFIYPKRYNLGCVYDIELNETIYISETSECLLLNAGELEIDIKLYPNPTEDILNIDCNSRIEKVDIYDINGNGLGSHFGDTQIRLSELESGVYFIRIFFDNHYKIFKVVKT